MREGVDMATDDRLNAIDICCGAGGWAAAGRGLPIRWVAVADWAEDCLETWRVNHQIAHPDCSLCRADLSTAEGREALVTAIGTHRIDLVVGGIPCEQLSTMRGNRPLRDGELDRLHALIDGVLGLVRRLRPRWWALEDVVQIERHLPATIELGYEIPYRRIEAGNYGPQRRLRTFLGRFPDPAAFADPAAPRTVRPCLAEGPHMTVPHFERYERTDWGRGAMAVANDKIRVLSPDDPSWTVMGSLSRGSRQQRNSCVKMEDGRLRRLDWREAARLQGFPSDYLFAAGLGRTEKMVGQAISIHVGRAIFQAIMMAAAEAPKQRQNAKC